MSPHSHPRVVLGLALGLSLAAPGCTGEDEGQTTISPVAPPPPGAGATLSGLALTRDDPLSGVTVEVRDEDGKLVATVTTSRTGRWRVDGLDDGNYRVDFDPPAPTNDPATELRSVFAGEVAVTAPETVMRPMFFAPVLGGLLLADVQSTTQQLPFRVDPFDVTSAIVPGLEEAELLARAGTRIRFEGQTLGSLGIDADPSTTERELLVEVAVLRPEELPAPLVDADGHPLSGQVFYALYPTGFAFEFSGGGARPIELDVPNANGLGPSVAVAARGFDYHQFAWVAAGTGAISTDGLQFAQAAVTGPVELGIFCAPGPCTPTTDVVGQITSAAVPLARAGIAVVTSSGFFGVTDATGAYRIEGVPIPLGNVPLRCTAYTDRGLELAQASASAAPAYPETAIDIDFPVTLPAVPPSCDLASSEPAEGATDVHTNDRIRIRFDREMDDTTLAGALALTATPAGGTPEDLTLTTVADTVVGAGGQRMTDLYVLPDELLPVSSDVELSISQAALDLDGNALAAPCTLSFRTGTSTLLLPDVYLVEPREGPVQTRVSIRGSNLDFVSSVLFDGISVTLATQTSNQLDFFVPASEGTEAPGPRTVQLDPGALMETFTILPRIDAIEVDSDPDPMNEVLVPAGAVFAGTSVSGVDQNDGTLVLITGQNLFDPVGMEPPVVTFGFGDGDTASGVDGDALIDAMDESATANRIDVHVPPEAVTGPLGVTVDFGGASPAASTGDLVIAERRADSTLPMLDMPSLMPPPGAVGVPSTQIITATIDEPVAGCSRFVVGTGVPLRAIAGTTRVTTTANGRLGMMEFLPDAGALPTSSTIFVQVSAATVTDLAGNRVTSFDYTFDTGVTAPTGGPPPDGGGVPPGPFDVPFATATEEAAPGAAADGARVRVSTRATREADILLAVGAYGEALAAPGGGDGPPAAGDAFATLETERAGSLSVDDASVADWGERAPLLRWADGARALFVAPVEGVEGAGTFVRLDLPATDGAPNALVHRFELASVQPSGGRIRGLVTDLDEDGRVELSLFPTGGSEPVPSGGVLLREDLAQAGHGFVELRIPERAEGGFDPSGLLELRVETLDLREASRDASPVLRLRVVLGAADSEGVRARAQLPAPL